MNVPGGGGPGVPGGMPGMMFGAGGMPPGGMSGMGMAMAMGMGMPGMGMGPMIPTRDTVEKMIAFFGGKVKHHFA
jgi:hypothetical protein